MKNSIPFEFIFCVDVDSSWVTEKLRCLIDVKNRKYKGYLLNNKNCDIFLKFYPIKEQFFDEIKNFKQPYCNRHSHKQTDSNTGPKTYLAILKIFMNNKKNSIQ